MSERVEANCAYCSVGPDTPCALHRPVEKPEPKPTERIEGEFHTAFKQIKGDWLIFIRATETVVAGPFDLATAESRIEEHDEQARHFIQQGREAALAEVDAAALKFGVFGAEHDENTGFCQVTDTDGVNSGSGYGLTAALISDGEADSA